MLTTSCKYTAPSPATTAEINPDSVFTAVAATAEAKRIEELMLTDLPSPEALLKTSRAPTLTATQPLPTTIPSEVPTATAVPTDLAPEDIDRAAFVADVSVPDGTVFQPNETFTKTWRLQNVGLTTWSEDYELLFISGDLMSGPAAVPLPQEVPPDESIDVSVKLIAPAAPGNYRGYWNLQNVEERVFGVGPNADESVWVDIIVAGDPAASATETPAPMGEVVTALTIEVDEADFTGECPHTFNFSALFTLNAPATVTYNLEVGTDFETKLPLPATQNLDAGSHTLVYELTFINDLTGWARMHVSAPEEVFSNQVDFTLTCE
jgi:hypothetical protein